MNNLKNDAYHLITFSPTGGTKRTADILSSAIADQWNHIDLLRPISGISLTADDICLIAVPSFGGRIPTTTAERLANIHANGARAILVCVYGNRAYEDTLSELQDVLTDCGFECVAAVAAIAAGFYEVFAGTPQCSVIHSAAVGGRKHIKDFGVFKDIFF